MTLPLNPSGVPRVASLKMKLVLMSCSSYFCIVSISFLLTLMIGLHLLYDSNFQTIFFWNPATTEGKIVSVEHFKPAYGKSSSIIGGTRRTETTFHSRYGYQYTVNDKMLTGISYAHDRLAVGAPVMVEYQKVLPTFSRIQGMRFQPGSALNIIFLLLPMAAIFFMPEAIRRGLRIVSFVENGILVSGTVVKKITDNSGSSNNPVYRVFFEFRTLDGVEIATSITAGNTEELGDDANEMLVYDPSDPQSAVLVDSLPRVVRGLFGR